MIVAVFGPDTPAECMPGSFGNRVAQALGNSTVETEGMTLLFSQPWMIEEFLSHAVMLGCKIDSFRSYFGAKRNSLLGISALNVSSQALFIFPYHTTIDEETGHNHPIMQWVALAQGLERNLLTDDEPLLMRRFKKRFISE